MYWCLQNIMEVVLPIPWVSSLPWLTWFPWLIELIFIVDLIFCFDLFGVFSAVSLSWCRCCNFCVLDSRSQIMWPRHEKLLAISVTINNWTVAALWYGWDIIRWTDNQAFSQKGVQASWDAPRTKNGRLWTPKFWGKREIIFNYFPKYINISETK
jgi:hypothetical protein